ncbi:hypothetical protein MMC07_009568 [Pseudocyphellaria aurata]|nr:hypothetical protein [Pseudocyphellaria aurata]
MPDEILDYIHVARWSSATAVPAKSLPDACCNGPSCQSPEPAYLQREPFIKESKPRYTESDRKWIACRAAELTRWRKEECARFRAEEGITKWLPDSIVMSDCCLTALAKHGKDLFDTATLTKFLEPWNGVEEYCGEILVCLKKNSSWYAHRADAPTNDDAKCPKGMLFGAERKATLYAARLSKKLKSIDNLHVARASQIDALQDQWRMENGVADAITKLCVKKAREAIEKATAKQARPRDDVNVKKLALTNSQQSEIGTYAATLQ